MPAPLRRDRRRWSVPMPLRHLEYREDFLDHGLIVTVEPAEFVAAERILRGIAQAFVAVGARAVRQVETAFVLLHQIVVGDERARNRNRVELAAVDALANEGRALPATRTDDRNVHVLLDGGRGVGADPLHRLAPLSVDT